MKLSRKPVQGTGANPALSEKRRPPRSLSERWRNIWPPFFMPGIQHGQESLQRGTVDVFSEQISWIVNTVDLGQGEIACLQSLLHPKVRNM